MTTSRESLRPRPFESEQEGRCSNKAVGPEANKAIGPAKQRSCYDKGPRTTKQEVGQVCPNSAT